MDFLLLSTEEEERLCGGKVGSPRWENKETINKSGVLNGVRANAM